MKRVSLLIGIVFLAMLTGCAGTGSKPLTAEGLFERHVEVAYGKKGIDAYPSITQHGTLFIDDFGIEAPIVTKSMAPNFTLFETDVMGMHMSNGCNAKLCWGQQPGQSPTDLEGDMLELTRIQSDRHAYEHIGQYYKSLEIIPGENADESAEYTVKATSKSGREDMYYFSKETGLLAGTTITVESPMGKMTQYTTLKDYKDVGGVLMPMTLQQNSDMANVRIAIEGTSFEPLSESDFVRPE